MIDYSIKFNGIDESKKTFYYSTDSKINKNVILRVYNTYLKYKEYETELELVPHVNYWTYVPSQSLGRFVEFRDKETLEIVGLFGLDGLDNMEDYDYNGYVKSIFDNLSKEEKHNVFFVFNEIMIRNTYKNNLVWVEENDLVVDIGFNYGLFTLESLKAKPSRVIAFEPNPKLVKTFKDFFGDNFIELHQKAVSNKNGTALFYNKFNPALSSMFEEVNKENSGNSYEVETIDFGEFILKNKIQKIDYLKVDCEGAEYQIFESIPIYYLSNNVRKVAIEFHHELSDPKVQSLLTKLKICGFKLDISQAEIPTIGMIYGKK